MAHACMCWYLCRLFFEYVTYNGKRSPNITSGSRVKFRQRLCTVVIPHFCTDSVVWWFHLCSYQLPGKLVSNQIFVPSFQFWQIDFGFFEIISNCFFQWHVLLLLALSVEVFFFIRQWLLCKSLKHVYKYVLWLDKYAFSSYECSK